MNAREEILARLNKIWDGFEAEFERLADHPEEVPRWVSEHVYAIEPDNSLLLAGGGPTVWVEPSGKLVANWTPERVEGLMSRKALLGLDEVYEYIKEVSE